MKKQLLSVLAVVTLLVTAFAAPVAQAAKPPTSPLDHGPIINRYSGDSASAYSYSTEDGCVYSDVNVMASTQTVKSSSGGNSTGQYATIYINRYDNCNGIWLDSLSGYAPIDGNSYQFDKQLNSAHLQASIPMYDWNGNPASNMQVDLTWAGSGDVMKGKSRSQYQSPGCKMSYSYSGSTRNATVSGTVSDGVSEYLNSASSYAMLQTVKSGEMTKGCGW